MPSAVALLAVILGMTACTSVPRSALTKITWTFGTNTFSYVSPKDLTLHKMTIDPKTGVVTIEGISAQVDQAAVQAASAARIADSAVVVQALDLAKQAGAIAAKSAVP